jgi:hypothetical protein
MANAAVVQPIDASQETQFAELCRDTSLGFRNSVDLVLIHNEEDVRGIQPRAVLNDLTVLLAVAAWDSCRNRGPRRQARTSARRRRRSRLGS